MVAGSPSAASTSTLSVLRWMMRTGTRLALPSSTLQTKAPSPPHWIASGSTDGIGVAGEAHRHLEGHAGAQRIARIVDPGLDVQGAALLVHPVVDGADHALEDLAGTGDRRCAETGAPTAISPAKRSGTQKSTMRRERSSMVAIAVWLVT